MPEAALVLSGGGAKGAFQVTAEKYLREEKDYHWNVIAGVSVGALNAVILGTGKHQRLEEIWNNITRDQVMTGRFTIWSLIRMKFFDAKSIYGNKPVWELIKREIDPNAISMDVRVGAVSLATGEYEVFRPTDLGFLKGVLASTAIPVIWEPVDVTADHLKMVDGGVRNVSPLGDVLDTDPEEVVVINCSPREPPTPTKPLDNGIEIGIFTLDLLMNEILLTDIREFEQINSTVRQARNHGLELINEKKGRPYKEYKLHVIEPAEPLGDTLDFSRDSINRSLQAGRDRAEQEVP